jgi:hypothetical protein
MGVAFRHRESFVSEQFRYVAEWHSWRKRLAKV